MMLVLSRRENESIDIRTVDGSTASLKRIGGGPLKLAVAGDGCKFYWRKVENNFAIVDLRVGDELTIAFPCGEQVDVACLYVGRQAKLGFSSQSEATVILRHKVAVKSQLAG